MGYVSHIVSVILWSRYYDSHVCDCSTPFNLRYNWLVQATTHLTLQIVTDPAIKISCHVGVCRVSLEASYRVTFKVVFLGQTNDTKKWTCYTHG